MRAFLINNKIYYVYLFIFYEKTAPAPALRVITRTFHKNYKDILRISFYFFEMTYDFLYAARKIRPQLIRGTRAFLRNNRIYKYILLFLMKFARILCRARAARAFYKLN